jgi:hypothetical protein
MRPKSGQTNGCEWSHRVVIPPARACRGTGAKRSGATAVSFCPSDMAAPNKSHRPPLCHPEAEGSAVSLSLAKAGCPICPDFLRRLVASIHFMRLSLLKGAHADLSSTAWQEIGVKPCFGLEWDTTALDAFFVIRRRRLARERETTCPWQITGEIDTAKLPWMRGPEGRPPKRQPSPEGLGINPKTI